MNDIIVNQYALDDRQGITSLMMNIKRHIGLVLSKSMIYRYMLINGIQSITRRKKRKYGRTPDDIIPNLIKRNFRANKPNQKWSIDISYINTGTGRLYLCAIKDMYDKSIVAHQVGKFMDNKLVITTVKKAISMNPPEQRKGLIVHSDQGVQFKSNPYKECLLINGITHSVSYKGSSVDNAPIESWFSALKCESLYLTSPRNKTMAIEMIDEYIYFYNHNRLQEQLGELTPLEYRNQYV